MAAEVGIEFHSVDADADAQIRPVRVLHIAPDDDELETERQERRAELRNRHAEGVARLMSRRQDLRGVHPLADLVADAVNWSA